jgi:quinol monooxygenase YgiN
MSISLIVSGIGAVAAAIGSGVVLARCFRAPRGDLIAWSIALLGLLVSLGAQTLGHLAGFDAAMFRAMELGGQVVAPLALILALSEVTARSSGARFCARLYIPALAIVASVVLALDPLADVAFSKAWPDPATYYQTIPDYLLMFVIGPVTAFFAVLTFAIVLRRAGTRGPSQRGWQAVLPAQLMGGAAAIALAYPPLQELVAYKAGLHLPVRSEFSVLCTLAVALTWLAGTRTGKIRLAVLHGRDGAGDQWQDAGAVAEAGQPDQTGNFGSFGSADEQGGVYRGDGLYRPERPDQNATQRFDRGAGQGAGPGWQEDQTGDFDANWERRGGARDADDWHYGDGEDGWRQPADLVGGGRPDYDSGEFATGDHDFGYQPGWQAADGSGAPPGGPPGYGGPGYDSQPGHRGRPDRAAQGGPDPLSGGNLSGGNLSGGNLAAGNGRGGDAGARSQLFGQIAIYTLLEDRIAEFDQLAERVVEQVRGREPDTLVFIVHAVPSAPMQRILYEVYRDRDAYQKHIQQPHVEQFESDRRPYVLATNVIELGLQQAKVSPFPSVADLFGEPGYDTSGFQRPDYLRDYGRTGPREHR